MKRRRRVITAGESGGFIGVDPGFSSGAIAWISEDGSSYEAHPLKPLTMADIHVLLQRLAGVSQRAVLERVGARPGQGVSSMFKFGTSLGALQMGLVAAGIRFELVTPSKWQGTLGCRTGGDKKVTRDFAQRLFPKAKVTHATADALLLAYYASRA